MDSIKAMAFILCCTIYMAPFFSCIKKGEDFLLKRIFSTLLLSSVLFISAVPTVQAAALSDLQNHWSAGDVNKLISQGAIGGYPDGTFQPDATITRAEFSKILRQSLALSAVEGNDFTDTANHWAVTDIHTLTANDIIVPAEYGSFYHPDNAITRREIAIMLVRAMGLNDSAVNLSGQTTSFSDDAALQNFDKGYLYLAKELGLIGGYGDGSFQPNAKATRAEASVMIVRLLNLKGTDNTTNTTPDQSQTQQNQNTTTETAVQTMNQVSYQLTVSEINKSERNQLAEQYVYATLQLRVQNQSQQAVTISNENFKTQVTYQTGAQVTAIQPVFSQTVAAGETASVTTTVQVLLPDNQVAAMVFGNSISQITMQLTVDGTTVNFTDAATTILQAIQSY